MTMAAHPIFADGDAAVSSFVAANIVTQTQCCLCFCTLNLMQRGYNSTLVQDAVGCTDTAAEVEFEVMDWQ